MSDKPIVSVTSSAAKDGYSSTPKAWGRPAPMLDRMSQAIFRADAAGVTLHRFILSDADFRQAVREVADIPTNGRPPEPEEVDHFTYCARAVDFGRPGDKSRAIVHRPLKLPAYLGIEAVEGK